MLNMTSWQHDSYRQYQRNRCPLTSMQKIKERCIGVQCRPYLSATEFVWLHTKCISDHLSHVEGIPCLLITVPVHLLHQSVDVLNDVWVVKERITPVLYGQIANILKKTLQNLHFSLIPVLHLRWIEGNGCYRYWRLIKSVRVEFGNIFHCSSHIRLTDIYDVMMISTSIRNSPKCGGARKTCLIFIHWWPSPPDLKHGPVKISVALYGYFIWQILGMYAVFYCTIPWPTSTRFQQGEYWCPHVTEDHITKQ